MRYLKLIVLSCFLLAASGGCVAYLDEPAGPRPPPGATVDATFFYEALAPYGEWLWVEQYGWVWTPWDVYPGWRPYTDGRWVHTPFGWTWVSDRAWGWAPFHYGRWAWRPPYGWIWVPGSVWAPAWVAWRVGDGWIGWAPLPPGVGWRAGFGLDLGGLDLGVAIDLYAWSFVEQVYFLDAPLGRRVVPAHRNHHLFRDTRDRTRYLEEERRVVERGIPVDEVEKRLGRPVPRYRVEEIDRPLRDRTDAVKREAVRVYRPKVDGLPEKGEPQVREPAPPPAPAPDARAADRQAEKDLGRLAALEEAARREVERRQREELRQPAPKPDPEELRRSKEADLEAVREQVAREKQRIESRKEREKERAAEAAKPAPPKPKVKPKPKPPKPPPLR